MDQNSRVHLHQLPLDTKAAAISPNFCNTQKSNKVPVPPKPKVEDDINSRTRSSPDQYEEVHRKGGFVFSPPL